MPFGKTAAVTTFLTDILTVTGLAVSRTRPYALTQCTNCFPGGPSSEEIGASAAYKPLLATSVRNVLESPGVLVGLNFEFGSLLVDLELTSRQQHACALAFVTAHVHFESREVVVRRASVHPSLANSDWSIGQDADLVAPGDRNLPSEADVVTQRAGDRNPALRRHFFERIE
jgi:hypothetical protein